MRNAVFLHKHKNLCQKALERKKLRFDPKKSKSTSRNCLTLYKCRFLTKAPILSTNAWKKKVAF
jgi:hypothetical protein